MLKKKEKVMFGDKNTNYVLLFIIKDWINHNMRTYKELTKF